MKNKFLLLATVILPLSLAILITIYVAWFFYPLEIGYLNLKESSGQTATVIEKNFYLLMDYLTNPFNWQLDMPDFPSSADGLSHFESVKKLFHLTQLLSLISLPSVIWGIKNGWAKEKAMLLTKLFTSLFFLPLLISLFAGLMGFNHFFTLFHQIIFPGDSTWLFHPDLDPIILILPERFFLHCFLIFFICYESLMLVGIYFVKKEA